METERAPNFVEQIVDPAVGFVHGLSQGVTLVDERAGLHDRGGVHVEKHVELGVDHLVVHAARDCGGEKFDGAPQSFHVVLGHELVIPRSERSQLGVDDVYRRILQEFERFGVVLRSFSSKNQRQERRRGRAGEIRALTQNSTLRCFGIIIAGVVFGVELGFSRLKQLV